MQSYGWVSKQFVSFLHLLEEQRQSARTMDASNLPDNIRESSPRKAVREWIEQRQQEADRGPHEVHQVFQEAKYAMVALADQYFIDTEWVGRLGWRGDLLEYELFDSAEAGNKIFTDISRMLNDRSSNLEVLRIYYYCIALGYQGQYRDVAENEHSLAQLRTRMHAALMQHDGPPTKMTPRAYTNAPERMP